MAQPSQNCRGRCGDAPRPIRFPQAPPLPSGSGGPEPPYRNPPMGPASYTPPPQVAPDKPDWDEIARGKVRCNLVCAVRSAGQKPDYQELEGDMQYVFHGLTGQGTSRGGGPPPATDGIAPPEDPY